MSTWRTGLDAAAVDVKISCWYFPFVLTAFLLISFLPSCRCEGRSNDHFL